MTDYKEHIDTWLAELGKLHAQNVEITADECVIGLEPNRPENK
jgi:hypothetical protein